MTTQPGPAIQWEQLIAQLHRLGVQPGTALVVHTSLRAVGPVEGGPLGLIQVLREVLGPDGTLVMPSMTGNTWPEPFDPARSPTRNMGVVAETFWRLPGVLRGDHPTGTFAAAGPHAAWITSPQALSPVHGLDTPIGRVYQLDGWVLLLGVGHTSNTTIHLAELLNDVPYAVIKSATIPHDGQVKRVTYPENDHYCRRFHLVEGWLRAVEAQHVGTVGHAHARLVRSRDIVRVVSEQLRDDPTHFLCPRGTCDQCDTAWASVT